MSLQKKIVKFVNSLPIVVDGVSKTFVSSSGAVAPGIPGKIADTSFGVVSHSESLICDARIGANAYGEGVLINAPEYSLIGGLSPSLLVKKGTVCTIMTSGRVWVRNGDVYSILRDMNGMVVYQSGIQDDDLCIVEIDGKKDTGIRRIQSVEDLYALKEYVNAGYSDANDYWVQDVDLDMMGIKWVGMGTYDGSRFPVNAFRGTYDGDGHSIYNLSYDRDEIYNGVFVATQNATIKNLVVEHGIRQYDSEGNVAYVGSGYFGEKPTEEKEYGAGGVIGIASLTSVENVTTYGNLGTADDPSTNTVAGFIVTAPSVLYSKLPSGIDKVKIDNCINNVNIYASSVSTETVPPKIGGFVAMGGTKAGRGQLHITNCKNRGNIVILNEGKQFAKQMGGCGGFLGWSRSYGGNAEETYIVQCTNEGAITANTTSSIFIGQIVGQINGAVRLYNMNPYRYGGSKHPEYETPDEYKNSNIILSNFKASQNNVVGSIGSESTFDSRKCALAYGVIVDDDKVRVISENFYEYYSANKSAYYKVIVSTINTSWSASKIVLQQGDEITIDETIGCRAWVVAASGGQITETAISENVIKYTCIAS